MRLGYSFHFSCFSPLAAARVRRPALEAPEPGKRLGHAYLDIVIRLGPSFQGDGDLFRWQFEGLDHICTVGFLGFVLHRNYGGYCHGMAAGTTTISAPSGGMTGSATLTVSASGGSGGGGGGGGDAGKNLASIVVTPVNPFVPVNTVQQLTATGSYSDGSSADLTSLVTWTSSAVSKANVNASGVTGVAAGSASTATDMNGISGSTTVTVTAPSITAISSLQTGSLSRSTSLNNLSPPRTCRWIEPGPRQRRRLELLVDVRSHHGQQYGFGVASRRRNCPPSLLKSARQRHPPP